MTRLDRLATLGVALYGPLWQRAVARALEVDARQVQRWVAGKYEIPEGAVNDLIKYAIRHCDKVARAVNQANTH